MSEKTGRFGVPFHFVGRFGAPFLLVYTASQEREAMRILVAEDDAILADGLTATLRQSGYAVD
jgi:hypothetical protein